MILLAFLAPVLLGIPAAAAERGTSHYLPGYYGDFAVAVAPNPGFYGYTTVYHYNGKAQGPDLSPGASVDATASISGFLYAPGWTVLGAQYAFGGYTAYVGADLAATVATPVGPFEFRDEASGLTDTSLSPLSLYWSADKWHWNYYSAVFLPTGNFRPSHAINAGRNYYSFDNVFAVTWLDPKIGLEISVAPGIMFNTENPDTDYRTGTEFHLDYMVNQYFSRSFAIGIHGYVYEQLTSDRGPGAQRMDSSAMALGPSILWSPADSQITGKVVAKWLHEVSAENHFEGDIISLTGMLQF